MNSNYGLLTGLVDDIGALIAAAGAIILAFRGRNRWEPCEEDIPKGPAKISGSLTAAGIAYLWYRSETLFDAGIFFSVLLYCAIGVVVGFLTYVMLITVFTFDRAIAVSTTEIRTEKIIGGFWLHKLARQEMRNRDGAPTTQKLLEGAAYDVDKVWPRFARGLAKISFILAYLLVIISGSLLLTSGAIILDKLPAQDEHVSLVFFKDGLTSNRPNILN